MYKCSNKITMLLPTMAMVILAVIELLLSLVFVLIMVTTTSAQCDIYSGSPSTPAPPL